MKKNKGSKYPVSREELKVILLEGVRALKTYEDARIDHDLDEVKHLLQLDRVEKADELMDQIFVIDKKNALSDFKDLLLKEINPLDNNKYLEIMNALNEGNYNKAYYDLLFNDFINKGKWVHEKDKLKSEKQIKILKKFNGWYCTGK